MPKTWDSICLPKSVGALGFRRLHYFNKALISKLTWSISCSHDNLWVKLLTAKYVGLQSFLSSDSSTSNSSWIWKDILSTKDIIVKGSCLSISSNSKVRIWEDPWIPTLPSFKPSHNPNTTLHFPYFNLVRNLMFANSNCWNISLVYELFPADEFTEIRKICFFPNFNPPSLF